MIGEKDAAIIIANKIGNTKQLRNIAKIVDEEEQIRNVEAVSSHNNKKRKIEIMRAYLFDGELKLETNFSKFPKDVINKMFLELEKQKA